MLPIIDLDRLRDALSGIFSADKSHNSSDMLRFIIQILYDEGLNMIQDTAASAQYEGGKKSPTKSKSKKKGELKNKSKKEAQKEENKTKKKK